MLYNLAVLQPEQVHHGVARFTGDANPVAVQDDKVSIREDALDLHVGLGEVGSDPAGKFGDTLPAVLDQGIMLRVGLATLLCNSARGVKFVQQLLVECDHSLLVLFRHAFVSWLDFTCPGTARVESAKQYPLPSSNPRAF